MSSNEKLVGPTLVQSAPWQRTKTKVHKGYTLASLYPFIEDFHDRLFLFKGKIDCNKTVALSGYLQSWRYFNDYKPEILHQFSFGQGLKAEADRILQNGATKFGNPSRTLTTFVGVHIRRGDYAGAGAFHRGYLAGNSSFVQYAVNYIASLPEMQIRKINLVYFIVSDEPKWCQREFVNFPNFVILGEHDRGVGMCLLSKCDYLVLPSSSSTFGWWAGYLGKGKVIYNTQVARPGSTLLEEYRAEDFFPPSWIPI